MNTQKTTPWVALEALRAEKQQLVLRLDEIRKEEIRFRTMCIGWLGEEPYSKLTKREREVYFTIKNNPILTNKEIANKLSVTERTIKYHLGQIYSKYGCNTRRDLLNLFTLEGENET